MHFLEHWLGISPDAGSGAVEVLLLMGLLAGVLRLLARCHSFGQRQRW